MSNYWFGDHTDMTRSLLRMAGDDAHALWILSNALDVYETESEVDMANVRAHCIPAVDAKEDKQLSFIASCFPQYIGEWAKADEGEVRLWETEIIAGLFILRTGRLACATCLSYAIRVDQVHPREAGWVDCQRHREAELAVPRLRVVA